MTTGTDTRMRVTSARTIATLGVVLTLVGAGCSSRASARPRALPPAPAASPTTTSTQPPTPTTLGVLPPPVVDGLRISPTSAPAGAVAPTARWLRVDRPDGRTQLVAVFRPERPGRHPVIVYLHGSSGLAGVELAWSRHFAARGFIVVTGCYLDVDRSVSRPAPPFWIPCPGLPGGEQAGSSSTRLAYEALLDTARALPDAEPGALGVIGVSYGGIVALTDAEPQVKAIVADSGYGKAGPGPVTAPVLLLGMQSDPNVSHSNVTAFETTLRDARKTVASHYYAGTGHVVTLSLGSPSLAADATSRAASFLHRYLG